MSNKNLSLEKYVSKAEKRVGCSKLKSLQLTGCPKLSTDALIDVLLNLSNLRYVACDKIGELFKNPRIFQSGKIFQVENFELSVSSNETDAMDQSDRNYVEKLSSLCPNLRTVKLNINQESDEYVKYLENIAGLQELIIDFPGSLGRGLNSFLSSSGGKLTQLGLSLAEYKSQDMKLIAEECKKLKIFHLFFTNYTNNEEYTQTNYTLPRLEGLYLGVTRSCNLDLVHKSLTSKILSSCPLLRTVYLTGVSQLFTDNFFCHLLQSQCLVNLENIHVKEDAQLSKKTLENLLLHCPNIRKVNISSWTITKQEIDKILEKLDHDNVNITLVGLSE